LDSRLVIGIDQSDLTENIEDANYEEFLNFYKSRCIFSVSHKHLCAIVALAKYSQGSYFVMLAFLITAISFLSFAQATVPSPAASADLICHTSNPAECYPREFLPTDEFRIVHDDQSIPKGLHVRLNLATGVKEAKINVPDLDESEQHYSDLTVEVPIPEEKEQRSDLIILEEPEEQPSSPSIHDQSSPEHQHPIRPPTFQPEEHSLFADSISVLKSSPKDDLETQLLALSDLQDLSHSYHWGVTLARDRAISHKIFQLLSASSLSSDLRSAAALLLGTAIHNNPDALTAALSHFYNDEWPTGPLEAVLVALVHENPPKLLQRMVFALSGLCQDSSQLSKFVDAGGLEVLHSIFDKDTVSISSDGKLQAKIANFLLDHFLQIEGGTKPLADTKTVTEPGRVQGTTADGKNLVEVAKAAHVIESKLEGEDPCVLTNEDKEQDHLQEKTDLNMGRRMAGVLQPWCSVFPQGMYQAEKAGTVNIFADIKQAHSALERMLEGNGCSCDTYCSSLD